MNKEHSLKSILVVEDNLKNMKLMVDLLEYAGYRVLQAYEGEACLQMLEQETPNLIILDIGLPAMNGYTLYRRIKEIPRLKPVKIVACTASVLKEERERMIQCGFDAVITKPFEVAVFVQKIENILSQHC